VFAEAAALGVAIELDGNWHRQDLDYRYARRALCLRDHTTRPGVACDGCGATAGRAVAPSLVPARRRTRIQPVDVLRDV
jgi:hypothetical protein